jgi:hypothetical protein
MAQGLNSANQMDCYDELICSFEVEMSAVS